MKINRLLTAALITLATVLTDHREKYVSKHIS